MTFSSKTVGRIIGYGAGIAAGVSYGFNPLFAKPLLAKGVSLSSMLFFRYLIAMLLMFLWMKAKGEKVSTNKKHLPYLIILGLLFTSSSITLFESYNYIPSGLGTTLVYLYPVFTAFGMMILGQFPSWKVWLSIVITLIGVVFLCYPSEGMVFSLPGITWAVMSALVYAIYLIMVNQNKTVAEVSPHCLTLYALIVGTITFYIWHLLDGNSLLGGITTGIDWACLIGLAIFPTMISLLTLSISTRRIGATKTGVLGAFEPITAILIGTVVFGEPFTANIAIGVVLCIGAIVFMIVSSRTSSSSEK